MRQRKLPRGVFVGKDGLYWIRFADATGKIRRQPVGPLVGQAVAAYRKRKCDVREGKFFPEKAHRRMVNFAEVAHDFLVHSKQTKRDHGHDLSRSETLLRLWRDCPLQDLSSGRIEK